MRSVQCTGHSPRSRANNSCGGPSSQCSRSETSKPSRSLPTDAIETSVVAAGTPRAMLLVGQPADEVRSVTHPTNDDGPGDLAGPVINQVPVRSGDAAQARQRVLGFGLGAVGRAIDLAPYVLRLPRDGAAVAPQRAVAPPLE